MKNCAKWSEITSFNTAPAFFINICNLLTAGFLEYRCKRWERNDFSRQSGFQSLTIPNMLCVFATRHSRFAFSALVVGTRRKSYMPPICKWFLSKLLPICSDGRQKALLSAKIFWPRANHVSDCKKLFQILPCWNTSVLFYSIASI